MKKLYTIFSVALLSVALVACSGSRRMAKKAEKFEEAGLYTEAADYYLNSLKRNRDNVNARIGLKKNGQLVLDDHLASFYKAYSMGSERDAVYSFIKAKDYHELLGQMKVDLSFPDQYNGYYEEVKSKYLNNRYAEGNALMEQEKYEQAKPIFAEIAKLDKNFKDVSDLHKVAELEPLYIKGTKALEDERYRDAFVSFDKVLAKDTGYKDAFALKEEARQKAMMTIAVLPVQASYYDRDAAMKVEAYASSAIADINSPLIQLVDRQNVERLMEEQKLVLTGVFDENTAIKAGKLMGAKVVLVSKVLSVNAKKPSMIRDTKPAYEAYSVKVYDGDTDKFKYVTKYKKVYYSEYRGETSFSISVEYRLISSETGEVLASRIVEKTYTDKVHYATYSGNYKDLHPKPTAVAGSNRTMRKLFTANKDLKSADELAKQAMQEVAQQLSNDVLAYEQTRH